MSIKNIFTEFLPSKWGRWIVRQSARRRFWTALKLLHDEKRGKLDLKDNLSICAMFRNEASYLREWIEYHLLVGVDRFYLFDNESTDDSKKVLQPYIDSGIVVYEYVADATLESFRIKFGERSEKSGVAHWMGTHKCRKSTKWSIFIDPDEFIVPKKDGTITKFLSRFDRHVTQIILGWNVYGSNGHKTRPAGLVIESYTRRGQGRNGMDERGNFKALINPRAILLDRNHYHIALGKCVDETGRFTKIWIDEEKKRIFPTNICCVNHYIVRSHEECMRKLANNKNIHIWRYTDKFFDKYDCNDIEDLTILKWSDAVKKKISGK